MLKRLKRFGITAVSLWEQCAAACPVPWANFSHTLEKIDRDSFLVGAVALYVHLADEYRAGLLTKAKRTTGHATCWRR